LADQGAIPSWRSAGGHRLFDIEEVRISRSVPALSKLAGPDYSKAFELTGLQEHEVWWDVRETLGLAPEDDAVHIAEFGFEEMVNNAIDHSAGTIVRTRFWARDNELAFMVGDDGIGALERLRREHGLPDLGSALQELSKGKRTTAPDRHSGLGVFFTSRSVDLFILAANGWRWVVDNRVPDQSVESAGQAAGTVVVGLIGRPARRRLEEVFSEFSPGGSFDKTRPSVKLMQYGQRLISRSEARLLLAGLEEFAEVDLDFSGVDSVGQGFVDEVFRVWPASHSGTRIVPVNMNEAVRFMVERGLPGRA
jgi:anti-sigma regulatory factor (Ser/Thr protein kinase)